MGVKDVREKQFMLGKSKRFSIERYCAILDYFVSIQAEQCQENVRTEFHSLDYYTNINSLANEGLLKKYVVKRAGGGDASVHGGAGAGEDLTSVSYKCTYDYNFVKEVADKIEFLLDEYLVNREQAE